MRCISKWNACSIPCAAIRGSKRLSRKSSDRRKKQNHELRLRAKAAERLMKQIDMKTTKIVCLAMAAMLAVTAAGPDEVTIVSDVLGPEGPLYIDGNLYYVGWVWNTLSKWDGKTATVLNHTPGCGHNGLALTKRKTFLLACTEEHGAILELDMTGKQLRRWDADKNG